MFNYSNYFRLISVLPQTSDSGRHLSATSANAGPKLRLATVGRADAGVYTCAAYNGVGQRVADKLALRVHRE